MTVPVDIHNDEEVESYTNASAHGFVAFDDFNLGIYPKIADGLLAKKPAHFREGSLHSRHSGSFRQSGLNASTVSLIFQALLASKEY